MEKPLLVGAVLLLGISISLTVATKQLTAQGAAGAGASAAAQESSHSLNPIKWVRKDSKNSADLANRSDVEKKLTPRLQSQGLLPAKVNTTDACAAFTTLDGCLAALHASHSLGLDFVCLRAVITDVNTGADTSQCKVADGEKARSLDKAIHQLKPDANARQSVKEAEQQAMDDLKGVGE